MSPEMDREALGAFMADEFPQMADEVAVESLGTDAITVRLMVKDKHLRPGGTVAGPAIFSLVDVAIYLMILSRIGPVALAVTTNATIDFMRRPVSARDLLADVRLLKLGRSLAVCDALVRSEGSDLPVARASMTYAIPPSGR
ncbi:PaaI family thioesterase [Paracoccus pacificus]|uniref:PaaI family thioesterase n=1 Tax=Paracoccus pacificus TaxID=1463598 RepID=A0ABW4R9B8_9RHOB